MRTVSEKKVIVAPITLTNVCQISSQQWCPRRHLLRGCLKATQVQLSWIHFSSVIEETFHFKFEISKISEIFLQNFHRKFLKFFGDFQNFTWFIKIGMKSPSRENLLCVWLLSFSLKKKFKSWMSRNFFEFFENFRFYFSFEFLVWKRFTSFYSFW